MSGKRSYMRFAYSITLCAVLFLSLGFATTLRAQSTTQGAIGGTVTDPSGGVVANAKVVVHSNDNNSEQTVTTDSNGYYRAPALLPGTYTVAVDAGGFATYKAQDVIVTVGEVTEISAHLALASSGQTVLVTASTAQINTTSSEFAPLVDHLAISELPIQRPRWSNFALLTPGVVGDPSGFGLLSFRGVSTLLNNNTIDGADNNQAFFSEERGRTRASYSSSTVMIQEFQVNTSNYSAEYGRSAGGVVNTVTKSGSNNFHGEGFFYRRENDWGSRNPFATENFLTAPGVYTPESIKPTDWWNRTGFGIGGPIIKDKLFFFVAYDYFNRNFPGVAIPSAPNTFFATPSAATITSLAGNLGITSAAATTLYNTDLAALNTELGDVPRTGQQDIFFPKLDWEINSKNHFSVEFNRMRWTSPAGIQTSTTVTDAVNSFGNDYVWDTWGVARLNTTISPTMLNEARFQIGRDFEFENSQPPTPYEQQNLLTNPTVAPGYVSPNPYPPQVSVTNGFTFGTPTFLERPKYPDELRDQIADTVTMTHGAHVFKFGFDYSHVSDDIASLADQYGAYSYSSLLNYFTDLNKVNGCSGGKQCFTSYQQSFGPLGFKVATNDIALFAEDNWHIKPRLTLTLGLRWEDELLPSAIVPNAAVTMTQKLPSDNHEFGPRIGVAYDVFGDGKTSFRAGWGIYYGRIVNSNVYSTLVQTGIVGAQLAYSFSPGQAGAPTYPQVLTTQPPLTVQPALIFFDPGYKPPMIQEMDAALERQVGWDTVVSVSYLASIGKNLADTTDINWAPATTSLTYNIQTGGPVTSPTITTPLYTTRPNGSYAQMLDIFGVGSNYNALAIQVNHRLNHNVQFLANYTWSHALDYGEGANTTLTASFGGGMLDPFNYNQEYGNSIYNVPNRMVVSAVITSPWHVQAGWAKYLAEGWELSPLYTIENGYPYSAGSSGNAPEPVGPATRSTGGVNGSDGVFRVPTIPRDAFTMPRLQDLDLRITKKFTIREGYTLDLLGEAFNLFNHFNVTGVNTTAYFVSTSGSITNTAGTNVNCSAASPCLTFNSTNGVAVFGTPNTANASLAYTTRQIQVGVRFLF